MTAEQKKVAMGAASGVASMIFLVWLFYVLLPAIPGMDVFPARLALALQMNVLAVLPLFIGFITVGNGRFLSDAIDPTQHKESRTLEINGRFVDNTLQQNFIFFIGTTALSLFLTEATAKLLVSLAIVFVIARVIFWIGYRMNPLYRAPGMAATGYMNLGILVSVVYLMFT